MILYDHMNIVIMFEMSEQRAQNAYRRVKLTSMKMEFSSRG